MAQKTVIIPASLEDMEIGTLTEWKAYDAKFNTSKVDSIIEANRHLNVEGYDWWDGTYEYFKTLVAPKGFDIEIMNFSGFWSQGDGASFTAIVNIKAYLKANRIKTKFKNIIALIDADKISNRCVITRTSYRYVHGNSCHAEDIEVYANLSDKQNAELDVLRTLIEKSRYELCGILYKNLEEDYKELTSDEAVEETLISNEYELDENGKIC